MKRFLSITALLVALLIIAVAGVSAHGQGNSPAQLWDAGWFCFPVEGLGVHCARDMSGPSISVKVFDTDNPVADHAPFLGTELLLHQDVYGDQPCPQEDSEHYHVLAGTPYVACHHY